MYNRQQTK